MSNGQNKAKVYFERILIFIIPVISGICHAILQKERIGGLLSNIVIAVFAAGIYDTFLHIRKDYIYQKIKNKKMFWCSYVISFLALGLEGTFPVGMLCFLFVAAAALDSGFELSAVNYVYLMIQYAAIILTEDKDVYRFLVYLLIGLVIALLFSQLKEKAAVLYLSVILIAGDLTMQFAVRQFDLSKMHSFLADGIAEIISLLILALFGFCYIQFYAARAKDLKLRLLCLMKPDFDLRIRLEAYSSALMSHSVQISRLSEMAAEKINANAVLAKAGGFYHDIGKIEDEKNYIEAGIRLGKKADFPQRLLEIISQHSTAHEKPKSPEAAVVMLSDCIVSTGDYLAKSGRLKKITREKLVRSVFQNRIEKGELAEAGLTQEQIHILREFYITNTFSKAW